MIKYNMEAKLIRLREYSCPKCIFYVHREGGYTKCRFPEGKEKKCEGHIAKEFLIYESELPPDCNEEGGNA
jgi:hypothetical protein